MAMNDCKIEITVTDEFKNMVDDKIKESSLVEIAKQLGETNRLLAIIARASDPLAGRRVAPKPTMLKSVALDGTVREAEAP